MGCEMCEAKEGVVTSLRYTDGNSEELTLCSDCRAECEPGGFILDTEPIEG